MCHVTHETCLKTKFKADSKLIVVMWFQIFDRKSTVPSSGDLDAFRGRGRSSVPGSLKEGFKKKTRLFIHNLWIWVGGRPMWIFLK